MTIWLLLTMLVLAYMGVIFHLSIRNLELEVGILKDEINKCLNKHDFKEEDVNLNPEEDVK